MTDDAPDRTIERALAEVVASVAHPPRDPGEVSRETPLLRTGLALDSLSILELVLGIEKRFGVEIPPEDVHGGNLETLGRLADYVVRRLGRPRA